jgi:hypothetical protein
MSWRHGVRMLILLAQILHKYFYKNYRIGDVEGRQTMVLYSYGFSMSNLDTLRELDLDI